MAKKSDEKKISGINKFLYRGYEVYDKEGKPVTQASGDSVPKKPRYGNRLIRDQYVYEALRSCKDREIASAITMGSMFDGHVNQKDYSLKLVPNKTAEPKPIISELIALYGYIQLEDKAPYISYDIPNIQEMSTAVHPAMIRFIKAAIVNQMNQCFDFSEIVAKFVRELADSLVAERLILPIKVDTKNKLQEVVLAELNEFVTSICQEFKIKYGIAEDIDGSDSQVVTESEFSDAINALKGLD